MILKTQTNNYRCYVGHVYVGGMLTHGNQNRMTKSLEIRATFKLNAKVFE